MQCRSCNKTELSISQMKKEKGILNRGICKPCASEASSLQQFRRKVELNPFKYMECHNCDRYFSKNKGGRYIKHRIECPYCSSKNIGEIE